MGLQSLGVKSIVFSDKTINIKTADLTTAMLSLTDKSKEDAYKVLVNAANESQLKNFYVKYIDGSIKVAYGNPRANWWEEIT